MSKPTVAELLARIETLEHRVSMLEQEKPAKAVKPTLAEQFVGTFNECSDFAKKALERRPQILRCENGFKVVFSK